MEKIKDITPTTTEDNKIYYHFIPDGEYGIRLMDIGGRKPLRLSKLNITEIKADWNYNSGQTGKDIKSYKGTGVKAHKKFRYPGLRKFGVVIGQEKHFVDIEPHGMVMDPNKNISINVNDTVGNYKDNIGVVTVHMEI